MFIIITTTTIMIMFINSIIIITIIMGSRGSRGRRGSGAKANLRTRILDFRGLYSSIILISRRGILMSIGISPESLSQAFLVGRILVARLGVQVRLCNAGLVDCVQRSNVRLHQ